jgi:hypothetical protein
MSEVHGYILGEKIIAGSWIELYDIAQEKSDILGMTLTVKNDREEEIHRCHPHKGVA